jgi:hypothetical protein
LAEKGIKDAAKIGAVIAGAGGAALGTDAAMGAGLGAVGAGKGKRGEGAKVGAKTMLHRDLHPIKAIKRDWERGPRSLVVPESYDEAKKLRENKEG